MSTRWLSLSNVNIEYPVQSIQFRSFLEDEKFHNLKLNVTDNGHTGFRLALRLLALGISLFGTCRSNKAGVPARSMFRRERCKRRGVRWSVKDQRSWLMTWKLYLVYILGGQQARELHLDFRIEVEPGSCYPAL